MLCPIADPVQTLDVAHSGVVTVPAGKPTLPCSSSLSPFHTAPAKKGVHFRSATQCVVFRHTVRKCQTSTIVGVPWPWQHNNNHSSESARHREELEHPTDTSSDSGAVLYVFAAVLHYWCPNSSAPPGGWMEGWRGGR
uniref:Uncharacterized protein n=1 Tax=Anopheles minimus TaxID=112268 RepID=A0A182WMW4_9DIPT